MHATTVEQVLQQIWTDPATKAKLEADPKGFLKSYGIEIPAGMSVELHEDSPSLRHFILPENISGDIPATQDPVLSVIGKAMKDSSFKEKLLADPKQAVKDIGVTIPDAIDLKVYQNSPSTLHLVLPTNPVESELSDADLEAVAGGLSKSNQAAAGGAAAGVACGVTAAALAFTIIGAAVAGGASAVGGGAAATAGIVLADKGK